MCACVCVYVLEHNHLSLLGVPCCAGQGPQRARLGAGLCFHCSMVSTTTCVRLFEGPASETRLDSMHHYSALSVLLSVHSMLATPHFFISLLPLLVLCCLLWRCCHGVCNRSEGHGLLLFSQVASTLCVCLCIPVVMLYCCLEHDLGETGSAGLLEKSLVVYLDLITQICCCLMFLCLYVPVCFSAYSLWIFLSVQIGFQKDCNLLALWLNQPLLIMHCIAFPKLRYWMHTSFWPNYLESCGYGRGLVSVCLCRLLNSLIWCYCRVVASTIESSVQLFPRA